MERIIHLEKKELYLVIKDLANTIYWYENIQEREWSGNNAITCIELILRQHGVDDETIRAMQLVPDKANYYGSLPDY